MRQAQTTLLIIAAVLALFCGAGASAQDIPNNSRGFDPEKTYLYGSIDSVNVFNGNLMLTLPIGQRYAVSQTLQYGLTLMYNSKVWDFKRVPNSPGSLPAWAQKSMPTSRSNAGLGWTLHFGKLYSVETENGTVWGYESPDGGDHGFGGTEPQSGSVPTADNVGYTRDGTHLRLRHVSAQRAEIDFPNGVVHRFEPVPGDDHEWRITRMFEAAAPANYVSFSYPLPIESVHCKSSDQVWQIADPHLRTHEVCLASHNFDEDGNKLMVEEVYLSAFGAQTAKYDLHYAGQNTQRSCDETYNSVPLADGMIWTTILTGVDLPDGSNFGFTYNPVTTHTPAPSLPRCDQGTIHELFLPTGGSLEWKFQHVGIPASTACGTWEVWQAKTTSIHTKVQRDADLNEIAKWEYLYELSPEPGEIFTCMEGQDPEGGFGVAPNEELRVIVVTPTKDRLVHYFSVWPGVDDNLETSPHGFLPEEHGVPYTRMVPDIEGRFLSTELYDCDPVSGVCPAQPVRQTYVVFDPDGGLKVDRRVKAERTIFVDDGGNWRDVENDDYDGLGHYRKSTVSGNFGRERRSFTNYNPGADKFGGVPNVVPFQHSIDPGSPWAINTYDESWTEETIDGVNVRSRSLACFDSWGLLLGRRLLADADDDNGAHDIVTLYKADTLHNVEQEDWFGGDTQDVSGITDLCSPREGSKYRVTHAYDKGALISSSYRAEGGARGVFFTPSVQTIDARSGLVKATTDASGITTTFDYDESGRLKSVASPGAATVSYDYKKAGDPGFPNAAVLIDVDSADAQNDSQQRIDFDSFGRLVSETRQFPGGEAVRATEYDGNGRKSRVSMWEAVPSHFTSFEYDALGRTTLVTAPDGKASTMTYAGERTLTRTALLGNIYDAGTGTVLESHVGVTEVRDLQGRLLEVQEGRPATVVNGVLTAIGAPEVKTAYKYDVGDRLTHVDMTGKDMDGIERTQERRFEYDRLGFLRKEKHPESGWTEYKEFDAKGHARYIDQDPDHDDIFDLEFVYDAAERQTEIRSRSALDSTTYRVQKEFVFDSANNHGKSHGKLVTAKRHNYTSLGDIVVTESFTYGDTAGRLTNKTTKVENATAGTTYQEMEQSSDYNDLGLQKTITYPTCAYTACGSPAWPSITQTYDKGYLKSVSGFIDDITYHPNGLYDTITHAGTVQVKDVQLADEKGLPRPKSISVEGGVACPSPVINTQPESKTIPANTSIRISVAATGALHYQWYEGQSGVKTSPLGLDQNFLDTPVISATRYFWVEITNSCGFVRSVAARIDVISCGSGTFNLTVSPANMTDNTPFTLTAPAIANTTYRWFRGPHAAGTLLGTTTTNTWTINTGVAAPTQYFVEMQDPVCNVTAVRSQVLTVTPCAKPLPREIHSVANGSIVTLSVEDLADGATFQWYQGSNYNDLSKPAGSGPSIIVTPSAATSYWVRMTRSCGGVSTTADTPVITVNVACATSIFVQPLPATKAMPAAGSSVSLSTTVVAGGSGPFTYQWYEVDFDGTEAIPGATSATYTWSYSFSGATAPLAAQRIVFVKVQACGIEVESNHVMLSVVKTPQKIYAFNSRETLYGSYAAKLYVHMEPQPGPQHVYDYEWYQADGTPTGRRIGGDQSEINVGPGTYWVKVSGQHNTEPDPNGNIFTYLEETVSEHAYVSDYGTCELPPLQVAQSVSSIISGTPNVIFQAFCDWPNVAFQWYEGQTGDTREPVAGTAGRAPQLSVSSTNVRSYWVRASLECGAFEDSPTLIFTRAGCAPVLINQNIASVDVAYNATARLNVDPISIDRPSYTWYREGETASVGTGTELSLPNVIESGRYWVKVRNLDCSNSSDSYIATVRVATCPSITPPVWQTEVWTDKDVPKTLSAQSGGASGYQWYEGEVGDASNPIGGATLATYTTPALAADTRYWVRVYGSGCIVDSPTITVKVCDPPHLTREPFLNHNVVPGQWAMVSVDAEGTGLTYQWYQGLTGNTSQPFGRKQDRIYINTSQTNNYWVRVSGHCGPNGSNVRHVDSPTYTVSVCPVVQPPTAALSKVMPGTTTTVSVSATGTALTYQWYITTGTSPMTAIPGATTATITTPPITGPTTFSCQVKSGNCPVQSGEVTIELCDRPLINWTIGDKYVKKGELVFFYVNAYGTEEESPMITFYSGDAGNTATSTVVHGPSPYNFSRTVDETTKFWARATMGNCYADTPNITVTVCVPQIATQPVGGNITTGQSRTLTVATDIPAAGYQWYIGQPGETNQPIAGATSASVTVSPTVDTSYWVRVSGCGTSRADSAAALVTVCVPPAITLQPYPAQWRQPGQTTQLSVNVTGTNLTYKWYRGTPGDISNPVSTQPSISVSPAQTTSYWVRVSNGCGSADSNAAVINVCAIPEITQQPLSQSIFSGKTATLTVVATQATPTPMTYQWFSGTTVANSTAIAGATAASYTTPALTAEANYWVRITAGGCIVDSSVAAVSMCFYPEVLNGPDDRDIALGGTTRLSLVLSPVPESGRWYRGAQGDTSAQVSSYTFADVYPTTTTQYWAELTYGGCTAKTRTVTVFVSIPTITTHPASVQVNNGQTATLSVVANTAGLTYQWYLGTSGGGTAIAGATGASYTTPAMSATTSYWVKVTGSRGHTVNSNTATVSVCAPAAITQQPASRSIQKGNTTTITVAATGTNLRYQWYYGTSGTTTSPAPSTSDFITVSPNVPTSYWVKVTSDCGTVNSATATVTVCAIPLITQQPLSQPIFSGKTATLTVAATQETGIPISYQWYRGTTVANSTLISGATSPSYTTPALTVDTSYWVRLTSGACQIDSDVATVSMCAYSEITNAPDDRDIAVGGTTRLSVVMSPVPESGIWYRGAQGDRSVPISSQNAVDVYPTTTTQYWAEFTHGGCTTKTRTVTVFVSIPTITTQPASVQVNNGQTATLSVAATPAGNTYQWYLGTSGSGTAIAGATGASYTTPAMSATTSYWVKVTGSRGHTVNSNTATVSVCAPATITQQPASRSIQKGNNTILTVAATGTNLRYQWYYGTSGTTTSPAPSTSDFITVSPNVPTSYWVKVTSDCGVLNSNTATVTVCATPVITQQPLSQPIFSGKTATLSVAATQETGIPISYQWYTGTSGTGTAIAGATSSTYTTPALTAGANYWVRITSGVCSVDSNTAAVSMCSYPEVLSGPDDRDIAVGGTTRLSLVLSPVPESGRWYRGAQGDRSVPVSSYTYADVNPATTTQYWGELTYGGCTAKTRTVTVFVSIPTITTHPASVQVNNGQTATLTVVANTSGLTYQWYLGTSGSGTPIAGATGASYTTPAMSAAANYWVKVTGSRGHAVNSNTATVSVCAPATITQQPASRSIQKGNNTILTVAATGTNLRYQWYYGTSGTTTSPAPSTSDFITVSPNVPTSYWVKVTSDCGVLNSNTATVTVCATPVITQQPLSQPIFSGKTATLSVAATQETGIPISYQWYTGTSGTGTAIAGATSSTYTTPALTADTNYWVRITSGVCSVDSNTAAVSMCSYPEVINGPADRDIAVGQTVRLSLTLSPIPESGRWYRGAQGDRSYPVSSYIFADVAPTVTTQYWAELTYGGCTAKTRTVTVFVSVPTITQHPASTQVNAGTSATLSVVANTTGLTYQWYSGASGSGTAIAGATGASYVTPALAAGSTANYWVKVTGSRGHAVNSNTATVTWCNPATITAQPISRSIRRGDSTIITVTATGSNIRYQWYYGVSGNTANAAPSQSSYITVSPLNPTQYWVRVTSDCGFVNSVTVNVDVCVDPTIDVQPLSRSIPSGTTATLSVTATSGTSLGLSYQWYRGTSGTGTAIAGATSSTYTTPALTEAADYWVLVQSGNCYAYSDTATIDMCPYPATIGGPSSRNVAYQQQTLISVTLSPPPTQAVWYEGVQGDRSIAVSNATAFYLYPTATKQYWGELTYNDCSTKTSNFTVTVCVPTITTQPTSKTIARYSTTTLSVTAREATSYQWYIGSSPGSGTPISGATAATYTTPSLSATTSYWVRVTGPCNPTKNSTVATVTVN